MAEAIVANESVIEARADARIPKASGNAPVFPQRISGLPTWLVTYNEPLRALVLVAAVASTTVLAHYEPPPDTKSHVGFVLSQAFSQGCSLADVALAAGLPREHVLVIAKRTIPGADWLKQLYQAQQHGRLSVQIRRRPTFQRRSTEIFRWLLTARDCPRLLDSLLRV